jgi:hypothetical protein
MEASALRSVRFCASSEDPAPVKRITRPTRFHPRRVRCGSRNRGANQRCRDDWQGTGGTGGTPAIPCRWCLTRLTPGPSSRLAERAPGARVWLKHWRSRYGARGTRTPDLLGAMRSRRVPLAQKRPPWRFRRCLLRSYRAVVFHRCLTPRLIPAQARSSARSVYHARSRSTRTSSTPTPCLVGQVRDS